MIDIDTIRVTARGAVLDDQEGWERLTRRAQVICQEYVPALCDEVERLRKEKRQDSSDAALLLLLTTRYPVQVGAAREEIDRASILIA